MSSEAPVNPAVSRLLAIARERKLDTVWDRHRAMQPQCGFGQTGACCHACWKGPCRTDPFGNGPTQGICGASTDTIVARGLVRMIAAGTASHADHGRHLAHALRRVARGEASSHAIRDERKLLAVAARLGIEANGRDANAVAAELAERSLEDFGSQEEDRELTWAKASLSPERIARLAELGVLPHNIDGTVTQLMARTHVGCDADPVNLVLSGVKGAIADCAGMCLATEISDILFGTPRPTVTAANLGVLRADSVNIALNGHNPLLPEVICDVAAEMSEAARRAGAPGGINVVGVCCTGNEVMNRRGIPLAANYLSQEMVLLTGAVDAMVLDVQCIMPSLAQIGACFHTAVITTADDNKIPGAIHMPFQITEAKAVARKVVGSAIEAFGRRDPARVAIPAAKEVSRVGYSAEAVLEALSALNPRDPLEPLANALCSGAIKGIVLFNGCNTPSVPQDSSFIQIAKRLARENVLLLASGCGAGAFAKAGFMTGRAVEAYAGASLAGFLRDVGEAAGLGEPMPLVLHMGSCVDNSRAMTLALALAQKLGVDLDRLPFVVSAPEPMAEKAISIGTWCVALGMTTHIGIMPHITGSSRVVDLLTRASQELFGGRFIVETDPVKAAGAIVAELEERRRGMAGFAVAPSRPAAAPADAKGFDHV